MFLFLKEYLCVFLFNKNLLYLFVSHHRTTVLHSFQLAILKWLKMTEQCECRESVLVCHDQGYLCGKFLMQFNGASVERAQGTVYCRHLIFFNIHGL